MRRWTEISVVVPAGAADAVENHLVELGAPGTIEEDEEGGRRRVRGHLDDRVDVPSALASLESLLRALDVDFPGAAADAIGTRLVHEEDWAERWKRGFPPLDVGARLRIRPPWEPGDAERLDVVIRPAMAFGTGHHASTLGCLLALEDLARAGAFGSPVLDVGTGSGVLAIAAARLGAERVVAVDTDPIAVAAAAENVAANGLGGRVTIREGGVETVHGEFALVVANLYANLLVSLAPELSGVASAGGRLVASGLLDSDRDRVVAAAEIAGWSPLRERSLDGWTTLVFERRGP